MKQEADVENITLVCWQCGARKGIRVEAPPQFAMELAVMANDAGWKGVLDLNRHRSLVFCSDDCRKKALKKDGTYRKRPARPNGYGS